MAFFHAIPTPHPCESPQQQPASSAWLVKPPGPSHMSFCTIYPGKSQHWTLAGIEPRWTPQGMSGWWCSSGCSGMLLAH